MEETKLLEEDIEAVKEKVDDPMMCEKVRVFIYAPPEIQQFYKEEAGKSPYLSNAIELTGMFASGGGDASHRDRTEEFGTPSPFQTADVPSCQGLGEVPTIHQLSERT